MSAALQELRDLMQLSESSKILIETANWIFTQGELITELTGKPSAMTKQRKASPGNFDVAAMAAWHASHKWKGPMYVIPGNSYGRGVLHIIPVEKGYSGISSTGITAAYTPSGKLRFAIVYEDGRVFEVFGERKKQDGN